MDRGDDPRHLHRRALTDATAVVRSLRPDDAHRDTPCGEWHLAVLLAHMTGQNHGFARAIREGDAPVETYAHRAAIFADGSEAWPEAVATGWQVSVEKLTAALDGAPDDRGVVLAEIRPGQPLPLPAVVRIHLLDTVVHTWDVASALGRTWRPPEDLVAAALAIARRLPTSGRGTPGAAFGEPVPAAPGDDWRECLSLVGRSTPPDQD